EGLSRLGCRCDDEVSIDGVHAVCAGAQHPLWPQLASVVTGLAQQGPHRTVGAAYGNSMLAARLAHGLDTASWNPVDHVVTPDPARRERYDELYRLYRDLYPATSEISHALARIQQLG